ncbi:MAG: hypothetical protein JG762_863 [Deferribacteraceae bacterium]|nr:hypothetical protein [Deferribacteraceae bacterium]
MEKAPKGIKTTFHVWAYTEDDAKEHLSLNGWKILNIKKFNPPVLNEESKNNTNNIDNSNSMLQGTEDANSHNMSQNFKTNLKNINFVADIYFESGKYNTDFSKFDNLTFSNNKIYLIYGYTDSLPVKPNDYFKTNYELSILRALEVKKYLIEKKGLKDENLKIAGFGEFYPKKDNTFNGSPVNRRVEIYEYK